MTAREVQFFNRRIFRWTLIVWTMITLFSGYTHVHQDQVNPDFQEIPYLELWSLLEFFTLHLPWFSLLLVVVLILEMILLKDPWKMVSKFKKV